MLQLHFVHGTIAVDFTLLSAKNVALIFVALCAATAKIAQWDIAANVNSALFAITVTKNLHNVLNATATPRIA